LLLDARQDLAHVLFETVKAADPDFTHVRGSGGK
jgi:hypothetical protein